MDDLALEESVLIRGLDELAAVNRWLGGYGPSIAGVRRLLPAGAHRLSLLDVGTGGGDVACRLQRWAAHRDLEMRIRGIDLSPAIIEHARSRCGGLEDFELEVADLMDLPADELFDVVHCALVLHHFEGDSAAAVLARMFALARRGVVVNDLHRHPVAYFAIKLLTRTFSNNPMIRHDGPLSVLRAFQRQDLKRLASAAGLPEPEVRWHWGFRWSTVFRK